MGKLYAANRVVSADSTIMNGVVEIENAVVKRVFELEKRLHSQHGLEEPFM